MRFIGHSVGEQMPPVATSMFLNILPTPAARNTTMYVYILYIYIDILVAGIYFNLRSV